MEYDEIMDNYADMAKVMKLRGVSYWQSLLSASRAGRNPHQQKMSLSRTKSGYPPSSVVGHDSIQVVFGRALLENGQHHS